MPEHRTTPEDRPGRWRASGIVSHRLTWALLGAIVIVTLALGSVHPGAETRAARIAHLESIIKCPTCDDISIAQSSTQTATALRARVVHFVGLGWSDAAIEAWVDETFGTDEILEPPTSGIDVLAWVLPIGTLVVSAGLVALFLARRRHSPTAVIAAADEALVAAALDVGDAAAPVRP